MSVPQPISELSDSDIDTDHSDKAMGKAMKAVAWSGETGKSCVPTMRGPTKLATKNGGCAKTIDVLEVFSGSGNLSHAIRKQHLTTEEVDLEQCSTHDMSSKDFVMSLKQKAVSQKVQYCHLAPPCNTYSQARYPRVRTGSRKVFAYFNLFF